MPGHAPSTDDTPWWVDAVIYQVYPRSFADSNGDGEGDLLGIIDRLPYLADLGVNAIWLSPFYPSPMADGGYDVADPRGVDPRYGTIDDVQRLIDRAHELNLRVIVDIVPNHVSREHPWFREALASPAGSPARARFHVRDGTGPDGSQPPNNWHSLFTGPAWTRITEPDGRPGQWYLHLFDSAQPDLNWSNPEVLEDSLTTLRFWLDRGVDGFRVDVALGLAKDMAYADHHDPIALVEGLRLDLYDGSPEAEARLDLVPGSPLFDRDEVQAIYRRWREVLDSYPGHRMAVAEAWLRPERARRYIQPDTLHQIFNFDFLGAPWHAATMRRIIMSTLDGLHGASATWALSNHDSPRVVTRLGGGDIGRQRARALALLVQALPGSAYIFQGEELGLADVDIPAHRRQDPVFLRSGGAQLGRDGARVPLPWSGAMPPYGFGGERTWLPQPIDWADLTVEAQTNDPDSMLELYRAGLRIRASHRGLRAWEPFTMLDLGPALVAFEPFVFVEEAQTVDLVAFERGHGLVSLTNCGDEPVSVSIGAVAILASDRQAKAGLHEVWLPGNATLWLQQ